MKKVIITFSSIAFAALLMVSCGGDKPAETPSTEPSTSEPSTAAETQPSVEASANPYAKGEEVYNSTCKACHQGNGEGIPKTFPPLAKSDYLLADKTRAIRQVIHGSSGEITVNGEIYNSAMPPQDLTDEQIADVLNYVLHSWGNEGETVTVEEVKAQRGN